MYLGVHRGAQAPDGGSEHCLHLVHGPDGGKVDFSIEGRLLEPNFLLYSRAKRFGIDPPRTESCLHLVHGPALGSGGWVFDRKRVFI